MKYSNTPSGTVRLMQISMVIKPSVIRVLRILARLRTAHKPEIASMAGFSETHIRTLLKKLQAENLIERNADW